MKTNKLILTLFISIFFVVSCSDENAKVSPTKTKAAIANVNQNLAAELGDLQTSPGYSALNSLATLTNSNDPFARISFTKRTQARDYIKSSVRSLRGILTNSTNVNSKINGSEPFDYNANKGVYTWTESGWTKAESTIIKIVFPVGESLTNNGEFQLTAYSEVYSTYTYEYNPTLVKATLTVDGVKQGEIDLSAQYNDLGDPVFIDLYLLFNPYSIDVNFNDKKSTSTSFSATLSKSNSTLIGVGVNATYYSSSKDESDIKSLSGHLQLMNVRFVVELDTSNSNVSSINDIVHITIKINGDTAGKVIFETDSQTGELVPYVKYTDGSKELLSTVFEDLAVELDGLF